MLIGQPDLAKERNLSKIVINRKDGQTFDIPYLFCQRETFYIFFTNLINSNLISELVSSDKTVFLCINATQVLRILINTTIFFARAQLQNSVNIGIIHAFQCHQTTWCVT